MPRWRQELRDLLELVLLPGLAAVLPWRWCFALFKRLAHWHRLYWHDTQQAFEQARALGQIPEGQEQQWLALRRLVCLVDHADYYLARTRSNRFMQRHLQVQGQWPAPGQPCICLTFHWGAGMWGLRHASQSGLQLHALVASLDPAHFAGRWVLYHYARARTKAVQLALGQPPLELEKNFRPLIKALRQQQQVLGVVDVPADQADASLTVTLRGRPVAVPRGLLRLAVDMQVPVVLYITGFDVETGQRQLEIHQLGLFSDVQALAEQSFAHLDAALQRHGALWHFWSQAPRFFRD